MAIMIELGSMKWPSLVSKVNAQEFSFTDQLYKSVGWEERAKEGVTVADFINPVLNIMYGIAAIILLINIVRAGLQISLKEKKGLEEAKKSLTNSIIGLTVVMLAAVITNILAGIFT